MPSDDTTKNGAALPRLLVARRLPEAVEARLEGDYSATLNPTDEDRGTEGLIAMSAGMDALLVTPTDRLDADAIGRLADTVKIVATFSVGFEHIDVAAAARRGLVVTNTPDVLTDATADMTILLMLAAARRAGEGERMVRAGKWDGWTPTQLMGIHVTSKRLAIIGMGRIGRAVAHRARAFGMDIHYHDMQNLGPDLDEGATFHGDVEEMLPFCDFLSLHCPLNAETRHFINAEHIARLPDGAVIVNASRGPVVEDEALIQALKSGKVAAAGLDVYEGEPALNPGYLDLDNVFLAPHLGSATVETRNAMGFRALDNLDAFFAGTEPGDRVA
ncbi:MAG: D-glycerate dehydrogenase [Rhodospirillales bacterium]|jgi:glyoxylate reductase|nr:D-glycerate dehydrogenase [Rhodospirillales bacterium]